MAEAEDEDEDEQTRYTVVKCFLKSRLLRPDIDLPIIEELVEAVSKTARVGSFVFNHVLRRWFDLQKPLDRLPTTKKGWKDLFRCCMTLGNGENYYDFIREAIGDEWIQRYREKTLRITGVGQALTYISIEYFTNFQTTLKHHVYGYLKSTMSLFQKSIGIKKSWSCIRYIMGYDDTLPFPHKAKHFNYRVHKFAEYLRKTFRDCSSAKGFYQQRLGLLRDLQIIRYKFGLKSMSLAPIYTPGRKFVTIDDNVFLNCFLSKENLKKRGVGHKSTTAWVKALKETNELLKAEMETVFDMRPPKGKEKKPFDVGNCMKRSVFNMETMARLRSKQKFSLASMFKTDGVSLCVYFEKPSTSKQKAKVIPRNGDGDFVIGIDPGRCNIAFAYGTDGVTEVRKKLTRKDYYNHGHLTAATKKSLRWAKRSKLQFQGSLKTVRMDEFIEYIDYNLDHWEAIWSEYGHVKYAKTKMTVYMKKNSTLDKFFNGLKHPTKNTVIAYGGGKFAPNGRGELSVPTTSLYKRCERAFPCVVIDEYHTSQYCPHCDKKMKTVKVANVKCRGLLRCESNECRSAFLHGQVSDRFARSDGDSICFSRDYVGAKNIQRCYFGRPECLRRPVNNQ
jgi:hypothetical protein